MGTTVQPTGRSHCRAIKRRLFQRLAQPLGKGFRLAQPRADIDQRKLPALLQHQRRKPLPANLCQQPPAVLEVDLQLVGQDLFELSIKGLGVQADGGGQFPQYRLIGNAPTLHIVCALQAPEQFQATTTKPFRRQHRSGRWRRIEDCRVITQQAVEISLAKRLPAVLGNSPVVGHHIVTQLRTHRLPVGSGHHAAAVQQNRQNRLRCLHQGFSAIAPATQGIVNVMKGRARHPGLQQRVRISGKQVMPDAILEKPRLATWFVAQSGRIANEIISNNQPRRGIRNN